MRLTSRVAVATVLSLLMVFSVPATALAELVGASAESLSQDAPAQVSEPDEDGIAWQYREVDGKAYIVGCDTEASDVKIPGRLAVEGDEPIEVYGISSIIEDGVNLSWGQFATVEIDESIMVVDESAFFGCADLTSVRFEETDGESQLCQINERAFCGCPKLASVTLPAHPSNDFYVIGQAAFSGAAMTEITIPATVRIIADSAFADCSNLSIVNGCAGLKQVEANAFARTGSLSVPEAMLQSAKVIDKSAFTPYSYVSRYLESNYSYYGLADEGSVYFRNDAYVQLSVSVNYGNAQKLLDSLNEARTDEGVGALAMDDELLKAAMQRAWEQSVYFGYLRPNGLGCSTLASKLLLNSEAANGVQRIVSSETCESAGSTLVQAYSEDILNGDYRSAGIGCALVDGSRYWVVLLCKESAQAPWQSKENGSLEHLGKQQLTKRVGLSSDFSSALPNMQSRQLLVKPAMVSPTWKARQQVQLVYQYKGTSVSLPSTVRFTSSDPSVATVDSSGLVTFLKGGTVSIRARLDGLPNQYVTSYTFEVEALKSLAGATVSGLMKKTYTGEAVTQSNLSVKAANGEFLVEGVHYKFTRYEDNVNAGTAKLFIEGINDYDGSFFVEFPIARAKQTMTLAAVDKVVNAKKKAFKVVEAKLAKGTVSYFNMSKTKAAKKFKVNQKTGKVLVPAKTKPGIYKLKIQAKVDGMVKAAGQVASAQNYESGKKTATVKVRVK